MNDSPLCGNIVLWDQVKKLFHVKFLCEISVAFAWKGQLTGFIQEIVVERVTERGLTVHQEQGETISMRITPLSQDVFQ